MKKNLLALLLGLFITVLILAGLEIFFRVIDSPHRDLNLLRGISRYADIDFDKSEDALNAAKAHPIFKWKGHLPLEEEYIATDEGVDVTDKGTISCYVVRKVFPQDLNFQSRVVTKVSRKVIYDVDFSFDHYGRRVTPERKNAQTQILLFGDSYTMGEGVNTVESAPHRLAEMRPKVQVYNLGLSGGSPNQLLYELNMKPSLRIDSIQKRKTIAVFAYMDNHLERMFCRSDCLSRHGDWKLELPNYSLENGEFKYQGTFADRKLVNFFYSGIANSAFANFFGIVWPPRFTQKHFDYFAEMMKKSEADLKMRFGDDLEFYVVFYPGFSGAYSDVLSKASEKAGLKVLNYAGIDMFYATRGRHKIFGDGHPTPITQYIYAYLLDKDLPK